MTSSTVSTRLIIPFVRVMDRMGRKPVKPSLSDVGLSRDVLASPQRRIGHQSAIALLEEAVRVSGRSDLGLMAAEAVSPSELEIWEYAMRTQPTVGRALESMGRLLALLHDGCRLETDRKGDTVTTRWLLAPGLEQLPAMNEFGVGLSLVTWRRVLKMEALTVSAASFPHSAPADLGPYERLFRCPVRFSAPFAGLTVPAWVLDVPLPQADAVLAEILLNHAQERIAKLPRPGLGHRVQELIVEGLSTGEFSATHVAKRMHMSSRTLQRRLEQEGVSFREVVDEVRRQLALRHLMDKHIAVNEVAFLLGFATPNAFHKAFKRWTGTTASTYRKSAG